MIHLPGCAATPPRRQRRWSRRVLGLVAGSTLIATLAACVAARGTALPPGSEPLGASGAWPGALIAAQSDVERGQHADADRRLREFAAEHSRSPEAIESTYWRAVFMLDPANTTSTARDAASLLDRYLGSNAPLMHRSEATVLQRIAKSISTREPVPGPRIIADPTREAEMKALRDELEQTKAELERIKKRVAPPPAAPATPPPQLPHAE